MHLQYSTKREHVLRLWKSWTSRCCGALLDLARPDCGLAPVAGAAGAPAQAWDHSMTKTKAEAPVSAAPTTSKLQTLIELLSREEGATLEVMIGATGWQAQSIRGALSGSLKKAKGLSITSEKTGAVRTYRILPEQSA